MIVIQRKRVAADLRRLLSWSEVEMTASNMEVARSMSGLFWLIGGALTALLLPLAPPTDALGVAGWAPAIAGVLICLWVGNRHFAPDVSLQRIYLAGYAGVLLIAALEWIAGGRSTPYHYLYLLPILFAAAAQPPRRLLAFGAAVAVVVWAPLLYEDLDRQIVLDIATELVTLLAVGSAVWALFVVLRAQGQKIREQRTRAELLAREDELTGLGNRRAFSEALVREMARARRGDEPLSILIGDLDNFKAVNDRLGHVAGDACLRRAAEALRHSARAADACFRWGGDEFAVLLPESDRADAERVEARVAGAIAAVSSGTAGTRLEITCGIGELGADQDADALIAAADEDLIARKRAVASGRWRNRAT